MGTHLSEATDDQIVEFYSNLAKITLTPTNGVNTRIANAFFMDKKFSIEKQYADTIKREYSAKVEALDFEQAKQAAETIDEFVSKTTEGKIKHFITEDLVSEALSLIVNAIYFKSKWKHEFSKDSTTNKTFYSSANSKKEIEFLNERDAFRNYAEDEDMEVLSLPYNDKSYAFNIILPKKRFGLNELRGKLSGALIQKLLAKLQPTILTISFPKINIETDFKLKEALIAMGVTEMFSDSADLTGIAKFPPLTVSKAAHKAIIEVDESGTVAAAVTVFKVAMATSVGQPMIRRFVADHPFIFVLTKDNNPLFMGQQKQLKQDESPLKVTSSRAIFQLLAGSGHFSDQSLFQELSSVISDILRACSFAMAGNISVNDAFLYAEMNFGLNMLRQSPMNETMAVSPLSVIFALALVHAGAEGDTKIQINQVISNGTTDDELIDFYSNLARSTLMPSNGVQARIANAFFLNEKYSIEKEYTDMIIENYSAEVEVLDFGQTKQATKTINSFVSKTTEGKIEDFLTEDIVSGAHSLTINAMYFESKRERDFSNGSSTKRMFRSSENHEEEVDLSSERDESRNDAEDEHMEVLSLRYNNTCCAFNIIFPKKMLGIDELKTNLSEATSQKLPSEPLPTVLTVDFSSEDDHRNRF
ncbi:hypothetical protein Y032_0421g1165 [Ancylostoma ceylanicum]|uniref:Serpin domain-containing protein n=1 Tax=Ancylostoma ceylanicum TaxID=53326 RepID=A0A016X1B1_9BILA|nr:hypothetical protein Y032_0421g1165 [Ancylostoma ceylanicum]